MKTIMYFIIFCCISASGVVAGGAKSLVWTSIRPTTTNGSRLNQFAQERDLEREVEQHVGGGQVANPQERRVPQGEAGVQACQSPTKIGNWIRAGRQPPTGLTPCFL